MKNYLMLKIIDEKLLDVKEVNLGIKDINNKKIKYYDEFILINSELKTDIIVNKYKKVIYENDYIINQGKIIISLNYYPFYQILIGYLNDINNFISPAFINFIGGTELEYSFSELKNYEFNAFIKKLNEDNNKIFDKNRTREVGALYNIDENRKVNYKNNLSEKKEDKDISQVQNNKYNLIDSPKKLIINNNNLNKNILKDENEKLKEELDFYKSENENLRDEINKLKDDNKKLSNELLNANEIITNLNKLQQNNQENIKMIDNLNKLIQVKDKEINDLKIKLINSGNIDKLMNNDDLIFVHFISIDEKINCGIKCSKTDTFAEVEEKLYQKYEEYRETNNNFFIRGKSILRFKKIFENNIKDGDKIILNIIQ